MFTSGRSRVHRPARVALADAFPRAGATTRARRVAVEVLVGRWPRQRTSPIADGEAVLTDGRSLPVLSAARRATDDDASATRRGAGRLDGDRPDGERVGQPRW